MHDIKINSTTGSEIITTANVKDFARISTSADDTIIANMIKTARIWCENYISRDIVAKNRTFYQKYVDDRFILPFSPIASISSLTVDGDAATYDTYGLDDMIVELENLPAKEGKITYVTSGLIDDVVKQAIFQLTSTYYDNRTDFVLKNEYVSEVPTQTKNLLSSLKTMYI